MDDDDGLTGQLDAGIELGDPRIVPLRDLAKEDACKRRSVEDDLAGRKTGHVHHRHYAADDRRELGQPDRRQVGRFERHVGRSEGHCLGLDLRDAAA